MTCDFLDWILIYSSVSSIKNLWSWRGCLCPGRKFKHKIKVGLHMLQKFLTFNSFCPSCFSHLVPFSLVRFLMAGFQGNKPGQRHWRLASSVNANCSTVNLFGLDNQMTSKWSKIINNINIAKCTIDPRAECFCQRNGPNKPLKSQFRGVTNTNLWPNSETLMSSCCQAVSCHQLVVNAPLRLRIL